MDNFGMILNPAALNAQDLANEMLRPGELVVVPAITPSLSYAYPIRKDFLAQLILPRNLSLAEVKRLCTFIETLVIPESVSAGVKAE